jgi:LuxR family transcriptional regulator, maltose regulon positive regulatory protein
MSTPILATKLYIPPPRPKVVHRPHLIEQLNGGLHRKLTLVAAPAGFGKTTLVSAWVANCDTQIAWLSLDEGDNDPTRFLTYLVAALQTITSNIGAGLMSALPPAPSSPPQLPPTETILTHLINEITSTISHKFLLVLDDYHVIESKPIDDAMAFLIEHLPPQMHLVIVTRGDLPVPLARLRSRDEMTELRVTDLRFTPLEAARFLNHVMGLELSGEDIDALETRTEGWIAGLQLAALSMQSHEDIQAFIRSFAGDHHYIVDYLVEEVLQRQPESTRRFLLQTSILNRLNGPLCDAVTGQQGGIARLAALERGNFFVVPLDDKRHWYRYHHLFADVLYTRLMAETAETAETAEKPGQVAALHLRASEWYEHNGSLADARPYAIRHALAAEDFERAADLVERVVPQMRRSSQEATMLDWFRALPDDLVRLRPVLSVGYAGALLSAGELDGVEARLWDAEKWLNALGTLGTPGTAADRRELAEGPWADRNQMVVMDEEEFRRLPGPIAMYRAGYAMAMGDVAGTVACARRVLDLAPEDDYFLRGAAGALLGLAFWASGDLEAAHRSLASGMASVQKAENTSDAGGPTIALADIRIAQGRLHEAANTYERALRLALQVATTGFPQPEYGVPAAPPARPRTGREQTRPSASVLPGTVDMYVGMSEIHRERNDLDAALQHLLRSKELGEYAGLPQNRYRWWVAMSRVREAQGDLDGALEALHAAERLYMVGVFPNVRSIQALRARVWIAQGKLGEAAGWAHERGLSVQDDLSYLREFDHITLARLLLARCKSERTECVISEALGFLERLLQAAKEGGRTGSVIEILMLQALAHESQDNIPAALMPLQRALMLAQPEGYVRIFVDEGMPMAVLLEEVSKAGFPARLSGISPRFPEPGSASRPRTNRERATRDGIAQSYVRRLLAAFEEPHQAGKVEEAEERPRAKPALAEPLSGRELEVLRLLRTALSGPEIARELTVSLHTVRAHTQNIYNKLGVNNRRAAVRRAEDLGLF